MSGSGKKVVSTNTSVDTNDTTNPDGTSVKKNTTTTVDTYSDGSNSTKTIVQTITTSTTVDKHSDGSNLTTKQVKTVTTTTTIDTYPDGSNSTKTQVKTIIETSACQQVTRNEKGTIVPIDPIAKKNAPKVDNTTDEKFLQDALKCHNDLRAKHDGSSPLTLNRELCKVSQAWANKIAAQGSMENSTYGYGENCFWGSHDVTDGKVPVEKWYSEIKDFNWKKIDHLNSTDSFTQVIWKSTKELGIAKAKGKDGSTYVVANYEPAGNVLTHYPENIGNLK